MDEVRLALRRLLKRPATSLAGGVTLAVAIGAAAATWSLLSAVLLHPLPVAEPDRVMVVGQIRAQSGIAAASISNSLIYPFYTRIRESHVFERAAAQWSSSMSMAISGSGFPSRGAVGFATHDFFDLLGVRIPAGRGFTEEDDRRGAAPVAILTDRYWRRTLAADPAVIGRTIQIAGKPVTIVGIAAHGFRGLDLSQSPDLYLPFHTIADVGSSLVNYFAEPNHRSSPTAATMVIGRLRAGETRAQTAARLRSFTMEGASADARLVVTDVSTAAVPGAAMAGMTEFARLLAITVGLLLLVGCATVGMLLLIRTEARRSEMAVCLALGASRSRLASGVAMEGILLGLAGAVFALPVSWWLFWGIRGFQLPGSVSIETLELSLDLRVLAASLACAVFATITISLIAGAFSFSARISDALTSRAGATPRLARRRTRAALVAAQVSITLVLIAGAGLFTRSLMAALSLNSDLDMSRLVIGTVSLGPYGYNAPRAAVFFENLYARLSANPLIRAMAFNVSQGGMSAAGKIVIDGVPRQFPSFVAFTSVDQNYFQTMRIPLLKGRAFSNDDRANAPLVVVVSESFGRLLAEGGDPIGRRVTAISRRVDQPVPDVMEVVGVVGDVVTNVSVLEPLAIYFPIAQSAPETSRSFAVRAGADPDQARRDVMSTIKQIDAAVTPPAPLMTVEERIMGQMSSQQFGAYVMGALGAIAVLLTLLGTYVVAESMAVLRLREMGIRAALGATRRQLVSVVLAETVRLVGMGLLAGLALAWAGAGTIRAFLFRVQPLDPLTLASMSTLILMLAIVVSLGPALRAARVDIGRVLKEE